MLAGYKSQLMVIEDTRKRISSKEMSRGEIRASLDDDTDKLATVMKTINDSLEDRVNENYNQKIKDIQRPLLTQKARFVTELERDKSLIEDINSDPYLLNRKQEINEQFKILNQLNKYSVILDKLYTQTFSEHTVLHTRLDKLNLNCIDFDMIKKEIPHIKHLILKIKKYSSDSKDKIVAFLKKLLFIDTKIKLESEESFFIWYIYIGLLFTGVFILGRIFKPILIGILIAYIHHTVKKHITLYKYYISYYIFSKNVEEGESLKTSLISVEIFKAKNIRKKKYNGKLGQYKKELSELEFNMKNQLEEFKASFDWESMRAQISEQLMGETEELKERIKGKEVCLLDLDKSIRNLKNELIVNIKTKDQIKSSIEDSFSSLTNLNRSPLLSMEYFFKFDGDRPITINLNNKAALIFYSGLGNEEAYKIVLDWLKIIIVQTLATTLNVKLYIADRLYGGAQLARLMNMNTEKFDILNVITDDTGISKHIEDMHLEYIKRIRQILTKHTSIADLNKELLELNSQPLEYILDLYYFYGESIITEDKLLQIIRSSDKIGIIPIFFVDINRIDEKSFEKTYSDFLSIFKDRTFRDNVFKLVNVDDKVGIGIEPLDIDTITNKLKGLSEK